MENKSNSLNRIKRQQREKVLRYSIRKYSFGAASVAVAALMFLGARVASADSVLPNAPQSNTANAGVVNPKDKVDSPVDVAESTDNKVDTENQALTTAAPSASTVDKAKLKKVVEELNALLSTKLNLDESVVSPVKERLQKGKEALESSELAQKDIDELVELLSKDVTVVSAAKEVTEVQVDKKVEAQVDNTEKPAANLANQSSPEVSASEESQTVSAKKDTLKVSVEQLQAAVLEVPEHETSKEVLEKANELLGLAQVVLENTTVSLNDVEDMTKRVKRMFNSVKNATTRLTSGARDSRNGQSIGQGTSFRANGQISSGALANIKYFASIDPRKNGGQSTRNNDPEFTKNKTDIKAYYMEDSQGKWIVYDVFFNNDGHKMTENTYQQHYYFQAPFNIMDPSNTVKELTFTRYRNTRGRRLSDGFQGFEQYGNTATISNPWAQQYRIFNADRDTFYDPNSGVYRDNQRWDVFKNNQYDPTLNQLPKDKNNRYPGASYHLGLDVRRESTDYAVHMHAKIKLKNNITEQEANAYGRAYAASVTKATGTSYSYIMGTLGTSLTPRDTTPPTITANNATVTSREQITPISVTAEDNRGGVGMRDNNPIEVSGLPAGLTYANNRITGTPTGAPGNSTVTIKAYDKNGNMATKTITITVRSQADAHNPTGSGLTVNQNHTITDAELKAKVSNYAPGTLSIVSRPSTATAGNAGNAVVKVTYPDGTFDNVNVPVTVTDVTGPTITANNATVTNREQITPIPVTAVDNTGGVGMRQNNPIEVTGLPAGLTYANNQITGTPTGPAGNSTVTIKAYDRNNTPTTKTITITVRSQADVHNPTGAGLTVNQNHTITDAELKAKVSNYAPGTLSIVSRPSTANAGNAGNAVVKVTYPDGTFDNVNVPVTVTDVTGPTITAESATVTKNESITPIPVTAVDNTGGVGMRDTNPIEVTNLPAGLRYANNQITGTPTAGVGYYTVTIKAYDKNNRLTTKQIRITVRSQADAHNPTGSGLTVNQNHTITDAELKAKVSNAGPGTLSIVSRPSTANAGNAGNAVVKVTYPDGTFDNVNVPVTVTDVTGPTITAESATVTKNESITPIPVTAVDNTGGVGMRDNNPIEVTNLPAGLRYANNQITGTPTAGVGYYTVTIKAYDKNNRSTTKQIRITVQDQASKYNPTGETLTVPYNHNITDDEVKAKVQNFAPGTLTVQSKPSTNTSGNVGNAVVKVTYPDGSHDTVNVPVVVGRPNKDDYTPKYNDGSGKPGASVEIPVGEANGKTIPAGTTYTSKTPGVVTVDDKGKVTVTIPADKNPGDEVTGKVLVRYPDGSEEEVPVKVTVVNRDKDDYTPKYNDGSGKPGESVEIPVGEANGKTIPSGTTYTSGTPGLITVDNKGKVTVTIPADKNPGDEVTGKVLVRYPDGSEEEVPVKVTVVNRDKDDYTPKYNDGSGKPGASVDIPVSEANGKTIPSGTTYTSKTPGVVTVDDKGKVTVTIPADKNPGDEVTGKVLVRYPDGSEEEVPVKVTVVNRDKDDYTPQYNDGSGKPGESVDIPVSEANGKTIPAGTTYTSKTPGVVTVDDKGKVTVTIPADKNPGDEITGKVLVRYPDGSEEEVPVKVTVVNRDKDDYTPKYEDGNGKPGSKVEIPLTEENGKKIPDGTTFESDQPGVIAVDKDGKVTVTIPEGAKPGDKITGKVLVRYPDGSTEEIPVTVTVGEQDKDIYTPKYEDGNGKPGSKVEIPLTEENGKKIPDGTTFESDQPGVITVDKDGKVTVTIPEGAKPGDKITGKILVRYPDGSTEEVPVTVTVGHISENGELPGPITLPELNIEVRWIDEDGNVLKPSVKTGNEKNAEHGTIPGYEFVRTMIDENEPVMTHIFRKVGSNTNTIPVAPVTPAPSPTTPVPDAVTPNADQVDNKTTNDNRAKSNDSQNVLPNTGTESNAALASLGLLGMLGGLGLALGKKKED